MLEKMVLLGHWFTAGLHQKTIRYGYVMGDLVLQDLKEHSSKTLVQVLSSEKRKMFGEHEPHSTRETKESVSHKAVFGFNPHQGRP